MDDALITVIQAMRNHQERLATISHNIANANTPGYKRAVPVLQPFAQVLDLAAANASPSAPRFAPVTDATAAQGVHTGRPLDLLVEGDAFLELVGRDGLGYARSGSFRLDPGGKLLDARGAALQGSGGALTLGGEELTIKADGTLLQGGRTVGTLKLVSWPRGALVKGGDGLLRPAAPVGAAAPAPAAPEGRVVVRTGQLEGSNVSTARESVMLLETSRSYEALARFLSAYDEQIGTTIQKLGEF